jgi:hypothetical protein
VVENLSGMHGAWGSNSNMEKQRKIKIFLNLWDEKEKQNRRLDLAVSHSFLSPDLK